VAAPGLLSDRLANCNVPYSPYMSPRAPESCGSGAGAERCPSGRPLLQCFLAEACIRRQSSQGMSRLQRREKPGPATEGAAPGGGAPAQEEGEAEPGARLWCTGGSGCASSAYSSGEARCKGRGTPEKGYASGEPSSSLPDSLIPPSPHPACSRLLPPAPLIPSSPVPLPGCPLPTALFGPLQTIRLLFLPLCRGFCCWPRFKVVQLAGVGATAVPIAIWTQGVRPSDTSMRTHTHYVSEALLYCSLACAHLQLPPQQLPIRLHSQHTVCASSCSLVLFQGYLAPLDLALIGAVIGGAAAASSALWYYSSR